MPAKLPDHLIADAEAAIEYALTVRKFHARRSSVGSSMRERDLKLALARLREAMAPVKSEIGRFPYGPQTDSAEENREKIREISARLQAERRKLWKMQKPKRKRKAA